MKYKDYKKYKISDERFRELMYFSCQYPKWKEELKEITVLGSPEISGMPKGRAISDPTGNLGTTYAELLSKVRMIEECVVEADPDIHKGLLKGVTSKNCTPNWLRSRGFLHCGNDKYYTARRKYFWLLDKRRG